MRMKKCLFLIMSFILIVNSGCQSHEPKEKDLVRVKSVEDHNRKKVILLVIDSLMAQAIDKGIQQKELPTFQYLIERGHYFKNMVSSFPTMSVAIDSSLITGAYPDGHHVPGLTWYSAKEKKLINYGTGPMEVMKQGVDNVLVDALVNLNDKHLSTKTPTIYEELSKHGLKSGSINGLIYRGPVDHQLSLPLWMEGPTSLPKNVSVKGPDFLALGALSNPLEGTKKMPDGITDRMGLNNEFSVDTANYLITKNKLPDFLYVYLPDLDQKLHKKGPSNIEGVKKVDGQLKSILQSFGSPEEALKQAVFIVIGDSGMTQILPAQENPVIELPSLLTDHKIMRAGESESNEVDIALAVNETMAYVYSLKGNSLRDIADSLKADPRIDIIAWTDKDWIYAVQGGTSEELRYKSNGKLVDSFGQKWTVEQATEVLDLKIDTRGQTLEYGQYPDVLRRLYGALHSHPGDFLVVTAKPGYELADKSSPTHKGGGGHGSLGQAESLVPLIISGTNQKPEHLRSIDLKSYLLKLLSISERK